MDIKAKLRPFYVAKMLYEQTDEEHYLTIVQIMDQLKENYGIATSRGTVGDDIKVLRELGIEINVEPSTQNRYYLIGRKFDLPELKTLIDAVESARFIPKEKSAALVDKIGSLTSCHNREKLVRNVDVENRLKADNEKIYYIMEAMNEAINAQKKVSFQYFTYNVRKEQKLRHDGYTYVFSPYKLIWNGDYYYVVGYSEKHQNIGSFRLDRIVRQPQILDDDAVPLPRDFDMNYYLNSMFRMYSGERKRIELVCDNGLMDAIIDKFGKDVTIFANDMKSFRAVVNTAVGNVFYSWVFGFGGKVSIKSPEDVKEQYAQMVRRAAEEIKKQE
jgi:predicted DNA-binding transcriptional regulator YafY